MSFCNSSLLLRILTYDCSCEIKLDCFLNYSMCLWTFIVTSKRKNEKIKIQDKLFYFLSLFLSKKIFFLVLLFSKKSNEKLTSMYEMFLTFFKQYLFSDHLQMHCLLFYSFGCIKLYCVNILRNVLAFQL